MIFNHKDYGFCNSVIFCLHCCIHIVRDYETNNDLFQRYTATHWFMIYTRIVIFILSYLLLIVNIAAYTPQFVYIHNYVYYLICNNNNAIMYSLFWTDSTSVKLFREAMKLIEDSSSVDGHKCIEFIPHTSEKDYANIEMLKE